MSFSSASENCCASSRRRSSIVVAVAREVPRHDQRPADRVNRGPRFGGWLRASAGTPAGSGPLRVARNALTPPAYASADRAALGVEVGMDAFGCAADADRSEELVGVERCRAENLGNPPRRNAPVHLHLPQAVLRMRITKSERGVLLARGNDVRNSVRVAFDADRLLHAGTRIVPSCDGWLACRNHRNSAIMPMIDSAMTKLLMRTARTRTPGHTRQRTIVAQSCHRGARTRGRACHRQAPRRVAEVSRAGNPPSRRPSANDDGQAGTSRGSAPARHGGHSSAAERAASCATDRQRGGRRAESRRGQGSRVGRRFPRCSP